MATGCPSRHGSLNWVRIAWLGTFLSVAVACSLPVAADETRPYAADVAYERGAHAFRLGELPTAIQYLERAAAIAPQDEGVLRLYSLALISSGQARKASALLLTATPEEDPSRDLRFVAALAHYRSGELEKARAGFAQVVKSEPNHAQAQLFLGSALQELGEKEAAENALRAAQGLDANLAAAASYRLGQLALKDRPDEARAHFETARDRSPGSNLARSSEGYLRRLPDPTSPPPSPWSAAASAGIEFDSNANIVGDDPILGSKRARDMRGFVQAGVSRKLIETERVRLHAGLVGFMSNHADEQTYDVQATRGSLFGSAALMPRLNADLLYSFEGAWQDYDQYHRRHFVKPALRFRENRENETRIFASFEQRDEFERAIHPRLDHDGKVRFLGIDHSMLLPEPSAIGLPSWGRPVLTASFSKRREDTDGADYDSRSSVYGISLRAPLAAQIELQAHGEIERRRFDNASIIEPTAGARHERIKRIGVSLSRPIGDRFEVLGRYHATSWGSNVQGFPYNRQIFSMMITYSFK